MIVPDPDRRAAAGPPVFKRPVYVRRTPPPDPRGLKERAADWGADNPALGLGVAAGLGAVAGWLLKRR